MAPVFHVRCTVEPERENWFYEQNETSQELRNANINVYLAETFVLLQGRAQSDLVRTPEIMPLMVFPLSPDIRLGFL